MSSPNNFAELVGILINIISYVIPLIFAVTLVVIIVKIIDAWILHAGEDAKRAEGAQTVLVGVIALFFMSAVWGVLQLLQNGLF